MLKLIYVHIKIIFILIKMFTHAITLILWNVYNDIDIEDVKWVNRFIINPPWNLFSNRNDPNSNDWVLFS